MYGRRRKDKRIFWAAGIALAGVAVVAGVDVYNDPSTAYQRIFTNEGKCLSGTRFDPDKEAAISTDQDHPDMTVIPVDANDLAPAVLSFNVDESGFFRRPTFSPADSQTAELLAQKHCPDATN